MVEKDEDAKPASNDDIMALVRKQALEIQALKTRVTDAESLADGGKVEFYHCNACGVRVEEGERCETHPNESVIGNGLTTDRLGKRSYKIVSQR